MLLVLCTTSWSRELKGVEDAYLLELVRYIHLNPIRATLWRTLMIWVGTHTADTVC
jgi:hypothetical protein